MNDETQDEFEALHAKLGAGPAGSQRAARVMLYILWLFPSKLVSQWDKTSTVTQFARWLRSLHIDRETVSDFVADVTAAIERATQAD